MHILLLAIIEKQGLDLFSHIDWKTRQNESNSSFQMLNR